MTPRERPATGSATGPAHGIGPGPARPGRAPDGPPVPRLWEEAYACASPAQRAELLALARRQGLLYAHQLPAPSPGAATGPPALGRLLAGMADDLPPVSAGPVAVRDEALDPAQRAAVARALATPDVCLIRGFPGTGKSRVVAEVIVQAAARGERVLLAGASAAAVDRALGLVADCDDVCAVRVLGPGEAADHLPAASRAVTLAERTRAAAEARERAARQAAGAEHRCRRRRLDAPVWDRLQDLAAQLDAAAAEAAELDRQSAGLPAAVAREAAAPPGNGTAGALAEAVAAAERRHAQAVAVIDAEEAAARGQLDQRRRELAGLQPRLEELRRLAAARAGGRWWTGAWWAAHFRPGLAAELAALEEQWRQGQAAADGLGQDLERLAQKRAQESERRAAECEAAVAAEVERRRADAAARAAELGRRRRELDEAWQTAYAALDPDAPRPAAPDPAATRAAREAWDRQRRQEEQDCTFAGKWAACLAENVLPPERLAGYANVVAGTMAGLRAAVHPDPAEPPFDLVVLQEADQLPEADCLDLARRARRWVLVGEPASEPAPTAPSHEPGRAAVGPAAARPGAWFGRLWGQLHPGAVALPYQWLDEPGQLRCRMRPVPPASTRWLETEPVADRPDIQLRILAVPGAEPVLAEVLFPPAFDVGLAKAYLLDELGELAAEPAGEGLEWVEAADHTELRFGAPRGEERAVPVSRGVREVLVRLSGPAGVPHWQTVRLEFDRAAGWDRPRAEAWVGRSLRVRDPGRTATLDTSYRMGPGLAAFVADLLFPAWCRDGAAPASRNGHAAPVEFVPVPPGRRGAGFPPAGGAPPRRGGAGLEIDVADPRPREGMPAELKSGLPGPGFANYAEAQAVVRFLEDLAAGPDTPPGVGVLALYPAQAELIRRLVRQSTRLAGGPLAVEVGVPAACREREWPVVLVSLTRSHVRRAVAFGDDPGLLALALTRARERLVLFGDPGALARRSEWDGTVEPLDRDASVRERAVLGSLVAYLQGRGRRPDVFRVHDGAGP